MVENQVDNLTPTLWWRFAWLAASRFQVGVQRLWELLEQNRKIFWWSGFKPHSSTSCQQTGRMKISQQGWKNI